MNKVGIIGFGHFGRALGEVLSDNERGFLAVDPVAQIPAEHQVSSLQALAAQTKFLVVAVPVPRIEEALKQLRPFLNESHTILDVGSVKSLPLEAMHRVLGDEIPHVGTHPLFGPTSLALGERPLNVVLCPSSTFPKATEEVRAFWESLDCRVIEQEAAAHDQDMAMTHALTFFVAKGMLDAGAGEGVELAPPSFSAISRTIETVRSDAGHLFAAIHRDNPFAGTARRKLIDTLIEVDKSIEDYQPQIRNAVSEGALTIPAADGTPPELLETRELIDQLDHDLVTLLGRRANLSKRAKKAKANVGRGVRDDERETQLMQDRRAWGDRVGLDEQSIADIFDSILRSSRRIQGGS
jgi:prephenate dehydrogenase